MGDKENGERRNRYSTIESPESAKFTFRISAPPSPILWQNADQTVTLIDIPYSISKAQNHSTNRHLLSSPPLLVPFASNEPKTASARAKLAQNTVDAELHAEYQRLLERALQDVKTDFDGSCCLPRPFYEEGPRPVKKRKLDHDSDQMVVTPNLDLKETISRVPFARSNHVVSFSNDTDETAHFYLPNNTNEEPETFFIPPKSSFCLGDCANSRAFHTAIGDQARKTNSQKEFDIVLLDPPWPNRSVKRTHQTPGSTYSTSPSLSDIRELILDMRLNSIIAEDSLFCMWITNKPAVRELVLGEDGIFACWDVELTEEWVWLKTTMHGESVTPLNALWRKPYEVLLLGRKRRKTGTAIADVESDPTEATPHLRRSVIIGVPDLHSRKPCLKELIEPLMPDRSDYRALEVFARHLVAGWWSWGDECIKFNGEGYWKDGAEQDECDLT